MRTVARFLLVCCLLFITAHRLPAPITEETPTPTTEHPAKSKAKKTAKSKTSGEESESSPDTQARAAAKPAPTPNKRFAGSWVGTMQTFPMGPAAVVLTVDSTETTMAMTWRGSTVTVKAQRKGDTLQATSPEGIYTNTWSITPQPDGATARVRMQAFMNDFSAIFHRTVAESGSGKAAR